MSANPTPESVQSLRELIDSARNIVFFTGAGISTESGIPDFRSPGGLWTKYQPIMFQDFIASEEMRREAWRRKIAIDEAIAAEVGEVKPNRGHRAVASLVADGRCSTVITQNIDSLHQRAGVPDEKVIEVHGNATYCKCLSCGRRYELAPQVEAFKKDETLPVCTGCGGIIKTATISFGQAMPEREMRLAEEAAVSCDLMIVAGSSLVVYPAAGLPVHARRAGARLVILNRDPTELDHLADLVLNTGIGPTLGEAVGVD